MTDCKYLHDVMRNHVKKGPTSKVNWNEIKLPKNNKGGWTEATAQTTLAICFWLWKNNIHFLCEAPMIKDKHTQGTRRADVLAPELYESQVIEIFDSEDLDSIEEKRADYAATGMTFIAVPANPEVAVKILQEANGL